MSQAKVNETENKAVEAEPQSSEEANPDKTSPTRFGDWEKNGRCIDF